MKATLHTDGGSRGNPGPAAIGYVLRIEDEETIFHGEAIGDTTNNQAEYQALLAGLNRAQEEGVADLECFLDSELVVKQLKGEYRVKDQDLKPHFEAIKQLAAQLSSVSYTHVKREKNKEADKLVNQALDNTS